MTSTRVTSDAGDNLTWATARTLDQLGELTARWLEGTIPEHPGYTRERPDDETTIIIPVLAAINRAGLITDCSQPGQPWTHNRSAQRAFVTGWCTGDTRERLTEALGTTELILLAEHSDSGIRIPVTYDAGDPYHWVGGASPVQNLGASYPDLHPDALASLETNWYATIIDPAWGRDDLLWPTVAVALGVPPIRQPVAKRQPAPTLIETGQPATFHFRVPPHGPIHIRARPSEHARKRNGDLPPGGERGQLHATG